MFNLDWSFTESNRIKFAAVAIVSAAITTSSIFAAQELRRQIRIQKLRESAPQGEAEKVCMSSVKTSQVLKYPAD